MSGPGTGPGTGVERVSPAQVVGIDVVTSSVTVLKVRPEDGFEWRAGQFAALTFPGFERREYSIANRAGEGILEFHIRNSGAGVGAHCAGGLCVGDEVGLSGPYGAAFFRRGHGGPILAIAGGTGLAPMKAVVEDALASGFDKDVHLYFGVKDEPDIYLERYFIAMTRTYPNFRFVTVLAEPTVHTGRRRGSAIDAVAADFQLLYGYQCYVSGPSAMVAACRQALKLKSVPAHDIFSDMA